MTIRLTQILPVLALAFALILSATTAHAQTASDTTNGTTNTTTNTTPGTPNTGAGGEAPATIALLAASAGIAALGGVYLLRTRTG